MFPVPRKYAEEHIEYLSTNDPQKRIDIVQRIKSSCTSPLLKEIHENHAQKKHNGSLVDSSDYLGESKSYIDKEDLIFNLDLSNCSSKVI